MKLIRCYWGCMEACQHEDRRGWWVINIYKVLSVDFVFKLPFHQSCSAGHTLKFLPSRIHFSAGVFSKNWVTKLMNKKVLMEFLAHINIQRFNCLWKQLGQQVAKWQKYKNTICFFFLLLESTFYILCLKKWVTKLMP